MELLIFNGTTPSGDPMKRYIKNKRSQSYRQAEIIIVVYLWICAFRQILTELFRRIIMNLSVRRKEAVPASATASEIVALHFKGQNKPHLQQTLPQGIMPIGTFLVCGECSDEGGGSSGQCACR